VNTVEVTVTLQHLLDRQDGRRKILRHRAQLLLLLLLPLLLRNKNQHPNLLKPNHRTTMFSNRISWMLHKVKVITNNLQMHFHCGAASHPTAEDLEVIWTKNPPCFARSSHNLRKAATKRSRWEGGGTKTETRRMVTG